LKTINNAIAVHKFDRKTKDEVDKYFENRIIKVFFYNQNNIFLNKILLFYNFNEIAKH